MQRTVNTFRRDGRRRMTTLDALLAACAMIATLLLAVVGIQLHWRGMSEAGAIVQGVAFPAAMTLAIPFTLLGGQSWRRRIVLCAVTLSIVVAFGYVVAVM
ncbi:MAG: hypothetical protein ABI895_25320 [Deltaproteobacteria bacterium]